jgi:hypothetical protein
MLLWHVAEGYERRQNFYKHAAREDKRKTGFLRPPVLVR